jgi:tyrosyl-tRNA synthetase
LSWHSNLSLLSFLRFPGKLLRVNALLTRESVKARLGSSQGMAYLTPTRQSGTYARFPIGISYAEFSYQLLQAYDFYVLHRDYGVDLQVGGSDQWGNIVSGVELIRKSSNLEDGSDETSTWVPPTEPLGTSKEANDGSTIVETDGSEPDVVYGLTIPLLTTSTGEKFGKSAGNAVWLDEKMTSVFDFYQVSLLTV